MHDNKSDCALPSESERESVRDALDRLLGKHWPMDDVEKAAERANDPAVTGELYVKLAEAGLCYLGSSPAEGGLQEILAVMSVIGKYSVLTPLLGSVIANFALTDKTASDARMRQFLASVHKGSAIPSISFGGWDGDRNSGHVTLDAHDAVSGVVKGIEDVACATHLLVFVKEASRLAIVEKAAPGVAVTLTAGLTIPFLAEVNLKNVPAAVVDIDATTARNLVLVARLCMVARAHGAVSHGFELVVNHAKERKQFGQPIGHFQALQHKLANNAIILKGVNLTLGNAGLLFDLRNPDWVQFALAAHAYASPALRQVALENHHSFGAIGFAEEHQAPQHFRRTHSDLIRFGGPYASRKALADFLVDQGNEMPDYDLGEIGNDFRVEVRQWLKETWTDVVEKSVERFIRSAAEKNYFAVTWPKSFGGIGASPLEQLAFMEELERVEAPVNYFKITEIQAQALMLFGTPEQQQYYLPKIARGEIRFCLGYSEPGSGSDLASLKTSAVLAGDEWVINGQKVWTTMADEVEYMWLAARTDAKARPLHAGISIFILPMNAPGLTIRPSMALYGHTFCQEFFDNVRVPREALIGEVNGGWKILTSALATERVMMGGSIAMMRKKFSYLLQEIRKDRTLACDARVRDRIAMLAAEMEVARQLSISPVRITETGGVHSVEASMSGVYSSELMQRLGEAALEILGVNATLHLGTEGAAPGGLEQMLRESIMHVVGGGTNEIQRSLIAQRGLGLPR